MKHKELTNHIQGSYLKKQFLEAFLVQSAYIESLLKLYADYNFFTTTKGESFTDKMLVALREEIERYGLAQLIKFLFKSGVITENQKEQLDTYRVRRNKVMHDLIEEINNDDFEEELDKICKIGTKIVESKEFKEMAAVIERRDKEKDVSKLQKRRKVSQRET